MRFKIIYLYIISLTLAVSVSGQQSKYNEVTAKVSFISSQHIYLKINSVKSISPEDTLFIKSQNNYIPAFITKYVSATSCAVVNLAETKYSLNDELVLFYRQDTLQQNELVNETVKSVNVIEITQSMDPGNIEEESSTVINGRLSLSSYSMVTTNQVAKNYQRWRYTLSWDADNLFADDLSLESYINFSYRADRWNIPGQNIWDKLKIYSLALNYKLNDTYRFTIGRNINNKLSSIGAVDGLQAESSFSFIEAGFVVGTRPDYNNYGISTDYLQMGAYLARTDTLWGSPINNTISVFQISKSSKTDRRFMYFQHSNRIIPDLFLFTSGEVDIYKRENGLDKTTFDLTNLYVSARYSPSSKLSLSASYDRRKNVMYYETFKSIADSLFDVETRQGFRGRINIKPMKYVSLILQYGTRSKLGDKRESNNYGATINYSRVPWIGTSTSLSFTRLVSAYVEGNMYGLMFNRFFFDGLLSTNLGLRRIEYKYPNNSFALNQNIIQLDAGIRIFGRDYLSISIETIMEQSYTNSRIYLNFTKRF